MRSKTLHVYGIDVFTDRPFCGNPAAVVLDAEGLSSEKMQAIASELNQETTFILKASSEQASLRMRYFKPSGEVELCGHGTIGAIWALAKKGMFSSGVKNLFAETKVGLLGIELKWDRSHLRKVVMSQLPPVFLAAVCSKEEIAYSIRVDPQILTNHDLVPTCVSTGRAKLLIPLPNWRVLDNISPDWQAVDKLCERAGVTGVYLYTLSPRNPSAVAEARQFPSGGNGAAEDPVTGVAACALGAFLVEKKVVEVKEPITKMIVEQGYLVKRPGAVEVLIHIKDEKIVATQISGRAVIVSRTVMRI